MEGRRRRRKRKEGRGSYTILSTQERLVVVERGRGIKNKGRK